MYIYFIPYLSNDVVACGKQQKFTQTKQLLYENTLQLMRFCQRNDKSIPY